MKSFLQTKEWADFKVNQGWQADKIDDIFVLGRNLFLGRSFLYVPEVEWTSVENLDNYLPKIKELAQKNNAIFTRLEILDKIDEEIINKLKENGFIKSFEELQPEYRQIIDLTPSEEEIFAQMKEKGRYNIRVAQKHNIVIEKSDPSTSLGVNEFYQLFRETAKRDGFEIRPQKYFDDLLKILGPEKSELLLAKYQGQVLAAAIIIYYEQTATYLYGASSSTDRQVMAPYLLHFQAMKNAKERGCRAYDLLAVAPELANSEQPTANSQQQDSKNQSAVSREPKAESHHKYAGISRFKRQFGGKTEQIVGSYDLVYQPFWYKMFKIAEKYRRR